MAARLFFSVFRQRPRGFTPEPNLRLQFNRRMRQMLTDLFVEGLLAKVGEHS
jgi:hypothetical protein